MQKKKRNSVFGMRKASYVLMVCALLAHLPGCVNTYERDAVGYYEVEGYRLIDSSITVSLPTRLLSHDKKFLAEVNGKKYHGRWKVEDIKEFTSIYLTFTDGHTCEGRIDESSIDILNPQTDFYTLNIQKLSFKKTK